MKRIKVLKLVFDAVIQPYELPAFRGAIIEQTTRARILFHNHITESRLRYAYPLVQYKMSGKNAAMICIEEGTEEILFLLKQFDYKPVDLTLGNRKISIRIEKLQAEYASVGTSGSLKSYMLRNWIGLNKANFEEYQQITAPEQQLSFMENILKANILSFFKGIELFITEPVELRILEVNQEKIVKYKGICLKAFDLSFMANVYLPKEIGLGKGVSLGFGRLFTIQNQQDDQAF